MTDIAHEVAGLRQQADRAIQLLDHILGRIRSIEKAAGITSDFSRMDDRLGKRAGPTAHERLDLVDKRLDAHQRRIAAVESSTGDTSGPGGKNAIIKMDAGEQRRSRETLRENIRRGVL